MHAEVGDQKSLLPLEYNIILSFTNILEMFWTFPIHVGIVGKPAQFSVPALLNFLSQ